MGMRMPETCWAVFKRQAINLRNCCVRLFDSVESMMMHGLANPRCTNLNYLFSVTNHQIVRPLNFVLYPHFQAWITSLYFSVNASQYENRHWVLCLNGHASPACPPHMHSRWRYVRSTDVITLTGEERCTGRYPCSSVLLFHKKFHTDCTKFEHGSPPFKSSASFKYHFQIVFLF
jgi:hypothetical protein